MSVADFNANFDSREAYTAAEEEAYRERQLVQFDERDSDEVCDPADWDDEGPDFDDFEDDGQPDEYMEWQDFMGGDDWDHGQYDMYDGE